MLGNLLKEYVIEYVRCLTGSNLIAQIQEKEDTKRPNNFQLKKSERIMEWLELIKLLKLKIKIKRATPLKHKNERIKTLQRERKK